MSGWVGVYLSVCICACLCFSSLSVYIIITSEYTVNCESCLQEPVQHDCKDAAVTLKTEQECKKWEI